MCGKIDCYLQSFAKLQAGEQHQTWTADTCFQPPHKPLLLLAVLEGIDSGAITRNFIEPSEQLVERFDAYWTKVIPAEKSVSLASPFVGLDQERFWRLVPQPGVSLKAGEELTTLSQLRKYYLGARFEEDLYPLLVMKTTRNRLRAVLLNTYIDGRLHPLFV